jgi:predicted glycogen debranching enzyme
MIQFGNEICRDLSLASSREWLETNGIGGFASSTITGLNTRRYHGLLTAATKPPVGRLALLSKLEETIVIDGRAFELSTNKYPGTIHPQGFRYLKNFRLDPFPIFTYEVEGIEIEKTIFMVHGENTTVIQYDFRFPLSNCQLEIRPLIAFRDYHHLGHERDSLNREVRNEENAVVIEPYCNMPVLYLAHEGGAIEKADYWYKNFELDIERERGFDYTEDLFNPFALKFELDQRNRINVIASLEKRDANSADELREAEIKRRRAVVEASKLDDEFLESLALAADQFIVARGDEKTVIAGYHWFSDWGRDTMIALPGLTLTTKRYEIAKSILLEFSKHISEGMLPNRFPDAGETPEYNTVDATLWYFEAIRSLLVHTSDYDFVRENLYEALADIIAWHVRGTRYRIKRDDDGLLHAGEPGVQLTWMDAKIGDWVVTPRQGKAVEIQALWHNALSVMKDLAKEFKDETREKEYATRAAQTKESFNRLFWNEELQCLYDVIDGDNFDNAIRPNQIFAASLYHSMLTREKAKSVVEVVQRELLTPLGLRSLSPNDPQYRPRYEGDPLSRDGAYHQGTVWGWLIGPFITAYMKTHGEERDAREQARGWLANFKNHLSEAGGLGQVSEIFDGDPPHTPRGCIAQAWSVAELLRAAVENAYKL